MNLEYVQRGTLANPYTGPAQFFSNLNSGLAVPNLSSGLLAGFLVSQSLNEGRRIAEESREDRAFERIVEQAELETTRYKSEKLRIDLENARELDELADLDRDIRNRVIDRLSDVDFNDPNNPYKGRTRGDVVESLYFDEVRNSNDPRAAELIGPGINRLNAQRDRSIQQGRDVGADARATLSVLARSGNGFVDEFGNPLTDAQAAEYLQLGRGVFPARGSADATTGTATTRTATTRTPATVDPTERRRQTDGATGATANSQPNTNDFDTIDPPSGPLSTAPGGTGQLNQRGAAQIAAALQPQQTLANPIDARLGSGQLGAINSILNNNTGQQNIFGLPGERDNVVGENLKRILESIA